MPLWEQHTEAHMHRRVSTNEEVVLQVECVGLVVFDTLDAGFTGNVLFQAKRRV